MELRLSSQDAYVDRYDLLDDDAPVARVHHGKANWFTVLPEGEKAELLVRLTEGRLGADAATYERLMLVMGERLGAVRALLSEPDGTAHLSVIAPGTYLQPEYFEGKCVVTKVTQTATRLFANRRELNEDDEAVGELVAAVKSTIGDFLSGKSTKAAERVAC